MRDGRHSSGGTRKTFLEEAKDGVLIRLGRVIIQFKDVWLVTNPYIYRGVERKATRERERENSSRSRII